MHLSFSCYLPVGLNAIGRQGLSMPLLSDLSPVSFSQSPEMLIIAVVILTLLAIEIF